MKITLEQEDIDAIVEGLAVKVKEWSFSKKEEEIIFGKKELAKYLKVQPSWVDKNLYKLPHFKIGKYPRFKKTAIDKFLDQEALKTRAPRRLMLLMMTG
jgi:hypothetical protein